MNIANYQEEYNKLKSKPEFYFGLAQSFVSKLLSLPPEKRYELIDLFRIIEEEAFEHGTNIPNLNTQKLETEKLSWENSKKTTIDRSKKTGNNFNNILIRFTLKYEQFFKKIKGYYLFKLENKDEDKTNVLILYDYDFEKHPEMNLFDERNEDYSVEKYLISEFAKEMINKKGLLDQNYLALFLITPKLSNNNSLTEINDIIDQFDNQEYIALNRVPVKKTSDYEIRKVQDEIENIENYSNKIFNNRRLSFEEEKILKQLFEDEGILDYKFLKKGHSGSKVIEIQPLRVNSPATARFVIKFAQKDTERKIKAERKKFHKNIMDVGVMGYSHVYVENNTHEAIKYNYASSDSKSDSIPFSELISNKINSKEEYSFSLENIINELFSCEPYKIWNEGVSKKTELVKDLYREYIKSEENIFIAISKIRGNENYKKESYELFLNFQKIKEYSLTTNKKICHGDLHSENFFKDDKGVYLIDFGWTENHHAVIDHATLECSLKYKHLPFYISIDELLDYEKKILTINSFSKSFDLSFIQRNEVLEVFKLVAQIREKAKDFLIDKNNPLEYFISLFIISIRQIQYQNLNQKYALENSLLLSKEILRLIN